MFFLQEVDIIPVACNRHIDPSVFINSLWLAVACIPAAVIVPLFVDRMGFKFFLGMEYLNKNEN